MEARCRCGHPILYPFHELGCIECGEACCPLCAFLLESAAYCAGCTESILEVPVEGGRFGTSVAV